MISLCVSGSSEGYLLRSRDISCFVWLSRNERSPGVDRSVTEDMSVIDVSSSPLRCRISHSSASKIGEEDLVESE